MKLSVCLITYNHEQFIAQALESVLAQQTDFDYEIVIGDDCSTDRTRQIAFEYQQRYPDKIFLGPSEKNLGVNRNLAQTLQACRGQYIALLEGDDYWTSAVKLQRQVDFLDSYPDCATCFHAVKIFHENDSTPPRVSPRRGQKKISTIEDLLRLGNFIPTCSAVFKNGLFGELPNWFYTLRIADFPLHVFNSQHGKIGYINQVMGAYRIHSGGSFSAETNFRNVQEVVRLYDHLNAYLDYKHDRTITAIKSYWEAVDFYRKGDLARARACAAKRASTPPFNSQALMAWLLTYSPPLYRLAKTFRRLVA
jgi:glycosyltransferase involved in cell wall biosynthesis